jgi:N-methylhydantoinase A
VRGRVEALALLDFAALGALLARLEADGRALLATAGTPRERVEVRIEAAMRYQGQGYEIDVLLERAAIERGDRSAMTAAFEQTYRRLFGRVEAGMPIEIVSWRLGVRGPRPDISLAAARGGTPSMPAAKADAVKGYRMAWFPREQGFVRTAVYDRYAFAPGSRAAGPALFEERESTLVVPPGAQIVCDNSLNLLIDMPKPG